MKKKIHRWIGYILILEIFLACVLLYVLFATEQENEQDKRLAAASQKLAVKIVKKDMVKPVPKLEKDAEKFADDVIEDAYVKQIAGKAAKLEYIEATTDTNIEDSEVYKVVQSAWVYSGSPLSRSRGAMTGPNGKETYYNLNMSGVVNTMRRMGNTDAYWERSDGAKMLGNYIMVAANLQVHPRGSIVKTSMGLAIVCDTGGFAARNAQQIDIATNW